MTNDLDLLAKFARDRSQDAFTTLVNRHVNLVYSAALRQVRSPQLAEEVAQSVFTDLARNAGKLKPGTLLTAWLYQVTRRTAIDVVRKESRRQLREQIAVEMTNMNSNASEWTRIEPLLDKAMDSLDETDRSAILLRYFENKNLREVGESLGTSDDAAQKRVGRAVERLREFFSKRNVTIGTSGLAVAISAHAVQAAPVGLSATISTAAVLAGTTVATATTAATVKTIAMTTLQKTLITATIATVVSTGIYEARQASTLRNQLQTLQQQQAPLAEQIQQLQRERDDATNRLASLANELAKMKNNNIELLKLRNEMAMLRRNQTAAQMPTNPSSSTNETAGPSPEDLGRELGLAVVRGDAGAFDKLLAESQTEHQSFNTNNIGLDDTKRGELSSRTFAPINAAFDIISDAAAKDNQPALDALARALQINELNGLAIRSLGVLAGNGDAGALEILINPEKYGVLPASSVGALQPAADNGNQKAIDALAAVAKDQKDQPLWYMAANGLTKAAAAGNPVAIDALISMSSSTNRTVQNAVAQALRGAAANQNAKAAETLRLMGKQ
jgi:RNA polymerase sigma factor (sigma-70 family)